MLKLSKQLLATKLKATAIHLAMSLIIFSYLVYLIVYVWYPQPYFAVDGGWQGLRLVAAVDLVLGPLITFLIFNLGKPRLEIFFDLLVIVSIQFGALAYGVMLTYQQRPVAIVLIDDFVVTAIEENYGGKLESTEWLKRFSDEQPPIIFADLPLNKEGLDEVIRIKQEEKVLEHAQLQLYRPFAEFKQALQQRQLRFYERLDYFKARENLEAWLKSSQMDAEDVLIAPFSARYGNVWLIFDKNARYLSYFEV